ncbi:hypothetical protein Tco_0275956 [Tanacetum coccineum]
MFTSVPGETIHSYYLRFAQLINDIHTIGMTMRPIQVNTKFINHLQLEWSKFVTDVKLAKDLHSTNFDQLYTYLIQHEAHANEVRIMKERFPNPLGYAGSGARSNATATRVNRTGGTNTTGLAKKEMLAEELESGIALDEEHMAFLADNGDTVTISQTSQEIPTPAAFQTNDLDAINSDCDEAPSASAVLMAKLFSYDSQLLSESNATGEVIKIVFDNGALGNQNPLYLTQAQRKVPALYCGHTIVKQHDALFVIDTEETLQLAEESRLKMHAKQNDLIMKEKKVNIARIDYVALNKLSKHFVKHFVPQKQLSA